MNLIKPKKLVIGDKIKIIAPSGPVNKSKIEQAVDYLKFLGYKVELGKHIFDKKDYLAGNDEDRLSDLHNAFLDTETKAIICARGGYGALRLVDKIDYKLVENNPKIFCGYSDITILNTMFLKNSNLITFSGPMLQSDFSYIPNKYTEEEFFKAISNGISEISPLKLKTYNSGYAEGVIIGGNLSTLASLCGRDFVPDTKFILVVEDLNEPTYKIDRYITQLLGNKVFQQNLSAILLGDFIDVDDVSAFDNYFTELANRLSIPIYSGYPISHSEIKSTLPIGVYSKLENGTLILSDYLV